LGLAEAEAQHGTLRVGAAGRRVLDGEAVTAVLGEPRKAAAAQQAGVSDPALFEALRKLRKQFADEQGVPPYVIFSDRTLTDMSSAYPQTKEAFLRVHGVGERKAEVYADAFLGLIRSHVAEHGMTAPVAQPAPAASTAPRGNRFREVGEAFNRGMSISELQEQWGVAQGTIVGHLYNFARAGHPIDPERILPTITLPASERDRVLALFDEFGHQLLGPVFSALEGKITYEDLHLLRLYYVSRSATGQGDPAPES
jgi:ATP-dependent DNA helicase RecQ